MTDKTVPPLTEGYVVKGGRNAGPSQIQTRPPAPGLIPTPPAPITQPFWRERLVQGVTNGSIRRWRHKKRGTTYVELGRGKFQIDGSTLDMQDCVIYYAETDWSFWVRPVAEFEDGRFERLPPDGAA